MLGFTIGLLISLAIFGVLLQFCVETVALARNGNEIKKSVIKKEVFPGKTSGSSDPSGFFNG